MAAIDHAAKTVSTVCQSDDEAGVRVALQEILDDNPGYKVVLVVEGEDGKEKTYTSLTSSRAKATTTPVVEPAEETEESTEEEAEEDSSDEESTEESDEDESDEATEEEE